MSPMTSIPKDKIGRYFLFYKLKFGYFSEDITSILMTLLEQLRVSYQYPRVGSIKYMCVFLTGSKNTKNPRPEIPYIENVCHMLCH